MKSRPIRSLTIIGAVVCGLMSLMLASCGSHRKSGMTAKPAASQGYSTASVAKSMGNKRFDALPDASQRLIKEADSWLGTPYAFGGTEKKKGVDCSGLTTRVYLDALNIKLPRSSSQQQQWCIPMPVDSLMIGDLVFFSPSGKNGNVTHVGIYSGDGRMIHSSTSRGVVVTDLSDAYFKRTYHSAGRVEKYYSMVGKVKSAEKQKKQADPAPTQKQVPTVSVDKLGQVLADGQPAARQPKAATPQMETQPKDKPKRMPKAEKTDSTQLKVIATVRAGASAGQTVDNPEQARRRALEKLKTEE